jgi:putative ABC transport system permease protein
MTPSVAFGFVRGTFAANRLRWLLTASSIALGVALGGAVHTLHASALAEIERSARALAGAADIQVRGPRNGFDDALFVALAQRPEVLEASPVVEVQAALTHDRGTLRVLGIDPMRAVRLQPAFAVSAAGAAIATTGLLDLESVLLSPAAAQRLGVRAGDEIELASARAPLKLRVQRIMGALQESGDVAIVDIALAQWRFGRLGQLSRIDLRLRPGVDAAREREVLAGLLPPGVVADVPTSISGRAASITRAYRVNLDALALVALGTGAFLVFSTLALQAARRRQELALLRALGVTRRGIATVLALEGAVIGAAGAAAGTLLGVAASRTLLAKGGADLGAGFFAPETDVFAPDIGALIAIAAVAVLLSAGGALWVARAVARLPVADALRDRTIDLPGTRGGWMLPLLLVAAGIPLLWLPAFGGLPLGGYAAIAAWLAAAVVAVGPLCRTLLRPQPPGRAPIAALALAQLRELPGHLAASIAGIVVSASLCVAMAIMVFSFRVSLEDWLGGVVGADLYVRSSASGDAATFDAEQEHRVATIRGVASVEPLRYDRVVLSAREDTPLSIVARPITPRILEGFQAEPRDARVAAGEIAVWISEAARDLHGWQPGDRVRLPIAGHAIDVRVAGIIRDYARTWGAVMFPLDAYRRITGDLRANDFAIHLEPGADATRVRGEVRAALGDPADIRVEDATNLRRRSLEIFDRSFAVTYALEAVAIAIGLAGVTSSFAALAWSRRREFGVLRFLGVTRRQVLTMIAVEGAAAGALGAILGLGCGIAVSAVLVHVVNRQSFHWSLVLHWPVGVLATFITALVLLCAAAARASGRLAVRREAVAAVKDDA